MTSNDVNTGSSTPTGLFTVNREKGARVEATSVGAGPSDETVIVPPPTEPAPELAWSLDDASPDVAPPERYSRVRSWVAVQQLRQ
jgi:hypothetical protein